MALALNTYLGHNTIIEQLVRFTTFSLRVFDQNEIHIQAFVDLINGKLMSGHSSSSTFHDFQTSSFLIITKQEFIISKIKE